ncbi:hypothetical protein PIB30_101350 [Stylosanthes scabra]|uniref:Uncharacterized protein n=1 Tax=Stylosanthes scabra TaxID=79078 RepID=A0ABU6XYW7_9FABA|nr:hypothetical protein [Stylosanthes scabra]
MNNISFHHQSTSFKRKSPRPTKHSATKLPTTTTSSIVAPPITPFPSADKLAILIDNIKSATTYMGNSRRHSLPQLGSATTPFSLLRSGLHTPPLGTTTTEARKVLVRRRLSTSLRRRQRSTTKSRALPCRLRSSPDSHSRYIEVPQHPASVRRLDSSGKTEHDEAT